LVLVLRNVGIAIAARMPMISITTSTSGSVKPSLRRIWRTEPLQRARAGSRRATFRSGGFD
jgi:hypothetical protein